MNKPLKKYDNRTVEVEIDGKKTTMALTEIIIVKIQSKMILQGVAECAEISEKKKWFGFGVDSIPDPDTEEMGLIMDDIVAHLSIAYNKEARVYDRIRDKMMAKQAKDKIVAHQVTDLETGKERVLTTDGLIKAMKSKLVGGA